MNQTLPESVICYNKILTYVSLRDLDIQIMRNCFNIELSSVHPQFDPYYMTGK